MSAVSAGEIAAGDVDGENVLSVSDDIVVDENVSEDSVVKSSGSLLGLADDQSDENESDKLNSDAQLLGVPVSEDILGAYDKHLTGGSISDIMRDVLDISDHGGGTLYLHGGTYSGSYNRNSRTTIEGVTICGGHALGDGIFATFTQGIYGDGGPAILLENWELKNIKFDSINCRYGFLQFQGYYGSLTNVEVNNCNSTTQFITISGYSSNNGQSNRRQYPVVDCKFTNCHQTYVDSLFEVLRDGHGQLFAVFGTKFENCDFINTSSNQHGGAMCIADESRWGQSYVVPTTINNCNFINIESRWFAVYIHGHFKDSQDWMFINGTEI